MNMNLLLTYNNMAESIIYKAIIALVGHLDRETVDRIFHMVLNYVYGKDEYREHGDV